MSDALVTAAGAQDGVVHIKELELVRDTQWMMKQRERIETYVMDGGGAS